jgi:translation initiation factor 4A
VCHSSVGGSSIRQDVELVRNGVHILVGTVGRVTDVINRKALRTGTDNIRMICLYGADQLLSHSFRKGLDGREWSLLKCCTWTMILTY